MKRKLTTKDNESLRITATKNNNAGNPCTPSQQTDCPTHACAFFPNHSSIDRSSNARLLGKTSVIHDMLVLLLESYFGTKQSVTKHLHTCFYHLSGSLASYMDAWNERYDQRRASAEQDETLLLVQHPELLVSALADESATPEASQITDSRRV